MDDGRDLRVGFRAGRYPNLTETFIAAQVDGLASLGHQVTVLADCPEGQAADVSQAQDATSVRYIWPRHRLLASGFQAMPYRVRRHVAAVAERRLCADNDVVVCNFGWMGAAVAASVAGRARRARLVTLFHGDDMSRTVTQGGQHRYRQLFREADLLLPVSEFWRRRLVELGAPEQKILVHHMGVNPQHFRFATREYDAQEPFEIITLGRLVEKKGTETVLQALAGLREAAPQLSFRLCVYGDGPLKEPLTRLCNHLGLSDSVEFRGPIPHDRVGHVLASSHLFVLPSVTAADGDMEGVPVVLMEAMASGVPVISSWHSGIPELIEDDVSGLLVRERDAGALSRQIALMAHDATLRPALARAARSTVEQKFNSRRQNAKLDVLLRELVASSPDPSPVATAVLGRV